MRIRWVCVNELVSITEPRHIVDQIQSYYNVTSQLQEVNELEKPWTSMSP